MKLYLIAGKSLVDNQQRRLERVTFNDYPEIDGRNKYTSIGVGLK